MKILKGAINHAPNHLLGLYSANSTADFSAAARYNKKKFYILEVKV